jgi:hypothetical protein
MLAALQKKEWNSNSFYLIKKTEMIGLPLCIIEDYGYICVQIEFMSLTGVPTGHSQTCRPLTA